MKIIVIHGSPKGKGNTYKIAQLFIDALNTYDNNEYEEIFLKDENIGLCKGCMVCVTKGIDKCPYNDEISIIINKIFNSDGVILASPNYIGNVPWLVKNFYDRLCSLAHRPIFFNQSIMVITTTAGFGLKDSLEKHSSMPFFAGFRSISKLGIGTSPLFSFEKISQKNQKKLRKSAKKFHYLLSSKKIRYNLGNLILYQAFKNIIPIFRKEIPKDYSYWNEKGWLSDGISFFVPIKGKNFQKMLSKFVGKMVGRGMKKELI